MAASAAALAPPPGLGQGQDDAIDTAPFLGHVAGQGDAGAAAMADHRRRAGYGACQGAAAPMADLEIPQADDAVRHHFFIAADDGDFCIAQVARHRAAQGGNPVLGITSGPVGWRNCDLGCGVEGKPSRGRGVAHPFASGRGTGPSWREGNATAAVPLADISST